MCVEATANRESIVFSDFHISVSFCPTQNKPRVVLGSIVRRIGRT